MFADSGSLLETWVNSFFVHDLSRFCVQYPHMFSTADLPNDGEIFVVNNHWAWAEIQDRGQIYYWCQNCYRGHVRHWSQPDLCHATCTAEIAQLPWNHWHCVQMIILSLTIVSASIATQQAFRNSSVQSWQSIFGPIKPSNPSVELYSHLGLHHSEDRSNSL